jgi:hypothetical protein
MRSLLATGASGSPGRAATLRIYTTSRVRGAVPKVHLGASYRNRPARVHPAARSAAPAGEAERRRPTSQTGPRVGFWLCGSILSARSIAAVP